MDTVKLELLRLRKIKVTLERQAASLVKMLEVIDNQLLGLEVEDLQLASNIREKMKEETCDNDNGNESDVKLKEEQNEIEMNTAHLDLDSKLDGMLSGQFYVEENDDDDDDMEELL